MPETQSYEQFAEDALRENPFPISATLEITHACNLHCRHCYLCNYRDEPPLTLNETIRILEELAEAGCLTLLITGGEPLLHPHFKEIWRKAKELGFILTLFTNATLITDDIAHFLTEWPPLLVEVSLYGASGATYERLTGSFHAFEQATAGIQRLQSLGCALHLKTPVLRSNRQDLRAIQRLAKTWHLPLYFDTEVFPRLDGDPSPLAEAIDIEESIREMAEDDFHLQVWKEEFTRSGPPSRIDNVVVCQGGNSNMHIDAYGHVCLCMLYRTPSVSIRNVPLAEAWSFIHNHVREQPCSRPRACDNCDVIQYCVPCAGKNLLATGNPETPSPYVCARTHALARALQSLPRTPQ